ncbi:polysaccharide export protein, BexD/CtrA/VexA family [Bacteroidales bacterium]|nr:polysaccharide export protein, BexD/CtrA/VexA family [Bacteroidales bacterium]
MKIKKLLFFIVLQCFVFSSCLTTKQTNLLTKTSYKKWSELIAPADIDYQYRFIQGDVLEILILTSTFDKKTSNLFGLFSPIHANLGAAIDEKAKLRSFIVDPSGKIHFPYVGEIEVLNKTPQEVREIVEYILHKEIIQDCFVLVYLKNRYFSVIGESRAASFPMRKEKITIFQALAESGDINEYGNRSQVKVIRQTQEGTQIRTLDLTNTTIINSDLYYIQANDVIYIEPMSKQFWGFNSFGSIFALVTTTVSLGILILKISK